MSWSILLDEDPREFGKKMDKKSKQMKLGKYKEVEKWEQ